MTVFAFINHMPSYCGVQGYPDVKELTSKFTCDIQVMGYPVEKGKMDYNGEYKFILKKGYRFDGASIPRFLWRLCGHPFQSPRDAAALVHDWLYASKTLPRAIADEIYASAQWSCGVSMWKIRIEKFILRFFGGRAWRNVDANLERYALRMGSLEIPDNDHRIFGGEK